MGKFPGKAHSMRIVEGMAGKAVWRQAVRTQMTLKPMFKLQEKFFLSGFTETWNSILDVLFRQSG